MCVCMSDDYGELFEDDDGRQNAIDRLRRGAERVPQRLGASDRRRIAERRRRLVRRRRFRGGGDDEVGSGVHFILLLKREPEPAAAAAGAVEGGLEVRAAVAGLRRRR